MSRKPTGSPFTEALSQSAGVELLAIQEGVPNPGKRYGLGVQVRATLLRISGDQSFVVEASSYNTVYAEAKKLGIKVVIKTEGKKVRVWRAPAKGVTLK